VTSWYYKLFIFSLNIDPAKRPTADQLLKTPYMKKFVELF